MPQMTESIAHIRITLWWIADQALLWWKDGRPDTILNHSQDNTLANSRCSEWTKKSLNQILNVQRIIFISK